MIEVEYRSFINKETYSTLEQEFVKYFDYIGSERQITYYLNHEVDTRVQITGKQCRFWQKLGKIHDVARQETEIILKPEDGPKLLQIFENLGYDIKIAWFRDRKSFKFKNINIELDNTVGYGLILEVEILCLENEISKSKEELIHFLESYRLPISNREVFDDAFRRYEENWRELTKDLDASWITMS